MRTPSRLKKSVGVTGCGFALIGLLSSPAFACLSGDSGATSLYDDAAVVAVSHHFADADDAAALAAQAQAAFRARLDAKLGTVADRLATKLTHWSTVPNSTVLTGDTRRAAKRDLAWAVVTSHVLAKVPTTGTFSASSAEAARIGALRTGLTLLAGEIRGLLANAPDPSASRQAKLDRIAALARTDLAEWSRFRNTFWDRDGSHFCDHDGNWSRG